MLSPRQGLPRIPLRGIFQGAKVVRGPDWEWGSQDGEWGPGGKVGSQDVGEWGGKVGGAVVGGGCHQLWLILMAWFTLLVGPLSSQEEKGSQAEWWTSVAGMWRQAGAWPV